MEWHELMKLTQGKKITIEKVRFEDKSIAVEGSFDLPPLALLSADDQVFVMAFVRAHGSIKDMENMFGISYPTVKNRLNHIARQLNLVEIVTEASDYDVLSDLEQGVIDVEEALRRLRK